MLKEIRKKKTHVLGNKQNRVSGFRPGLNPVSEFRILNQVETGSQFRYPKKSVPGFPDPGRPGTRFLIPLCMAH